MDPAEIARVRRFNRTVTQQVGALRDHYLARDRPLGEARVLWEIGEEGCDVRRLRARLDLDSGYLSRILRALEAARLVAVGPSDHDRRVRTARLTKKGRAERALLDERSDALAHSTLDFLTDEQRARLVSAMAEVERLLTAAQIRIAAVDPASDDAAYCLREYFAELDRRFNTGFDPTRARPADRDEMLPPAGVFLVATLRDEPIGCGGLKFHDDWAELKRMWVAPDARGLGIGRRLLSEFETQAAVHGSHAIRLDTNSTLTEAIAMYRSSGYQEIEPFNDERYAQHWFEKRGLS
jgi:DNA-binding MarR family transcriptional regulator/N-acetylglutamate synthase-like GNAT family acetyltransferase